MMGVTCNKPLLHPGNDHRSEEEDFTFSWRAVEEKELILVEGVQ